MQELKLENINLIIADVSRSGISFSHLQDELIDHICCEVEMELEKGLSFEKAYMLVKERIPINKLDQIQEETLKLIDKKYRIMKNTMKIIGLVSLALMAFGALFKIQGWPASGIMLISGFVLMAAVFLPSALYVWKKESKLKGSIAIYIVSVIAGVFFLFGILFKVQHYQGAAILILTGFLTIGLVLIPLILVSKLRDKESADLKLAHIIGAVSIIIYLFGDLFKIMHWPGALPMLIAGSLGLTTIFFPLYIYKIYKRNEKLKDSFIFICTGLLFFNMFILLLSLKVSPNVMSYFVKPGNEVIKAAKLIETDNNKRIQNYLSDTANAAFSKEVKNIELSANELVNYIENLKIEIISQCDKVDINEAKMKAEDVSLILQRDNSSIPTNYMLGMENNSKAFELKEKLDKFKKILLGSPWINDAIKRNIEISLDTRNRIDEENGMVYNWAAYYFRNTIMIISLQHLSTFQERVRISEAEVLNALYFKKAISQLQLSEKTLN